MTTTPLLQRPFTPPFYASTKPGDSLLKFASRTATDEVDFNKQQKQSATMITTIFHYCIFRITGANSPEKVDFETYASIDDELIIADRPTEDDIVASIINPEENNDDTEVTSE